MKICSLFVFSSMYHVFSLRLVCNLRLKHKELQKIKQEYNLLEYNYKMLQGVINLDNVEQYTKFNQNIARELIDHLNDEIELFRQIDFKFDKIEKIFVRFKRAKKSEKNMLKEILQHNCRMIDEFQKNIQIDHLPIFKNLSIEIRKDLIILVLVFKRNIFEIINITNIIYCYFQDIIELL